MTRGRSDAPIGMTAVGAGRRRGPGRTGGAQAATATGTATVSHRGRRGRRRGRRLRHLAAGRARPVIDQALPYVKQRTAARTPGEKLAIVFDIDNTTLETDFTAGRAPDPGQRAVR